MKTLIKNAKIVNEGLIFDADVLIEDDIILKIFPEIVEEVDLVIDASGKYLLPGVIDDQVHFRDPGLTWKGDIESESKAAIAGGVTSFYGSAQYRTECDNAGTSAAEIRYCSRKILCQLRFYDGRNQ